MRLKSEPVDRVFDMDLFWTPPHCHETFAMCRGLLDLYTEWPLWNGLL